MGELFPSLSNAGDDKSLAKLNETKNESLFNTIEYELSGIVYKINNINNISEDEIKQIIYRQHHMILNYDLFLMNSESRQLAQRLFTNKKFLKCFLDVVGNLVLSNHEKTCINKLAYDYYIYYEKDPEISDMLFQITTWINDNEVTVLSGILGINGARILSMIRNSSFKEEKNVHRVNTFIIKCSIELSVQDIINIYGFLFNRFGPVFIYSMLEGKPNNLTADQSNRFDAISVALLAIVDSLTSQDIHKILLDYGYTLKLLKKDTILRFSLHTALGYPRILKILEDINISDNIYIP